VLVGWVKLIFLYVSFYYMKIVNAGRVILRCYETAVCCINRVNFARIKRFMFHVDNILIVTEVSHVDFRR